MECAPDEPTLFSLLEECRWQDTALCQACSIIISPMVVTHAHTRSCRFGKTNGPVWYFLSTSKNDLIHSWILLINMARWVFISIVRRLISTFVR